MTHPLKVLQIVPAIAAVYGGPSQMVRDFSQALARAGAEVTIATTDANGDIDTAPLAVCLEQPMTEEDYTVYYFRCSPWRRYKFSAGLLRWLWQHAQDYDIAHIHALFSPVSSLAAMILHQQGVPYLIRPLGTLDPRDLKKKQTLKSFYAAILERANLARAAAIHFTSSQEAQLAERFGAKTPGIVLPLGVAITPPDIAPVDIRDRFDIPHNCPILLFLARFAPKKGLDLLLPALETLQHEGIKFHLLLCGANSQNRQYEQSIHQQIANSPLRSQTTFTGFVSGDLKVALLNAANLFVLPSYYENFGVAVVEAMAMGVPVIISNQVAIWPTIQQTESGWVCDCQITSLVQQLKTALQSDEERTRRGKNALRCAQVHYSWTAIACSTLALYRNILAGKPLLQADQETSLPSL